jgi:hypothetical protein
MTPWRQSGNRRWSSVGLNVKAPARKTKAQTRQRLRVVNIEACLLVRNPDCLVRQVDEVKSVW